MKNPRNRIGACVFLTTAVLFSLACGATEQTQTSAAPETSEPVKLADVALKQVQIEDEFWGPRIETNRTRTIPHVLMELEQNGNLRNFAIAAGLERGEFSQPYWADSDVYKWLHAASYELALRPDPELESKVDEIIAVIAKAQAPDGYLHTYTQIVDPQNRWTNLGFQHEMFSGGSLIEAGVAHFEATGKRTLLDVAIRYADNVDRTFGPGPSQRKGTAGHEQIEFALVGLYRLTGEDKYLRLAEFLLDQRGQKPSVFEEEYNRLPPAKTMNFLGNMIPVRGLHDRFYRVDPDNFDTRYNQDHLPVREQTEAVGHAVRAMYLYAAMADVSYETGDQGLWDALLRLHDSVTLRRMYVTGGIGPSEDNEGFDRDYDLPNESAYQETCATLGMALWNYRMLKLTGDGRYADLMELSFYNSFLGGVSLEGNTFCYVNPMRSEGSFERSEWYTVPCCPTTIVRTFPRMGEYIYNTSEDGLWVNLFIGSEVTANVNGENEVQLRQTTNYPWEGDVKIEVETGEPQEFTLHVRIPGWAQNPTLRLNGSDLAVPVANGYAAIRREWASGDTVELSMPMAIEKLQAHPNVLPDHGKLALRRGPLVYSLEQADNETDLDLLILPPGATLASEFRPDLLGGIHVLQGQGLRRNLADWEGHLYRPVSAATQEPATITAIPYAFWGNRGLGKMSVWIDSVP